MGFIALKVWCAADGTHADGKLACDGFFCTCPCHEGLRRVQALALANRPVGVL